jgi:hypothetical protein
MKILIFIILLIPAATLAQNFQGMTEADMEKMMMGLEQMANCMENIDQTEIEALEKRSRQLDEEIQALCAQGKKDAAQQKAVSFGREMAANPTVRQLQECGTQMQGTFPIPGLLHEYNGSGTHVCDQ